MERRQLLKAGAWGAGALALGRVTTACAPAAAPTETFGQGVTAGLHSPDAVVLWTRVEPAVTAVDRVTWQVGTTPDMTTIVASGEAPVTAATDHTVKVLVEGLDPDRSWWYRFVADGQPSPVGRARTLPAPDDDPGSLRLAFGSCQAYATGYYTAWRDVAKQQVDAVVFLGDFIYESPSINLLRPLRTEPLEEANTLERYRGKYRHYRSDVDLRAAAAAHPWSVVGATTSSATTGTCPCSPTIRAGSRPRAGPGSSTSPSGRPTGRASTVPSAGVGSASCSCWTRASTARRRPAVSP